MDVNEVFVTCVAEGGCSPCHSELFPVVTAFLSLLQRSANYRRCTPLLVFAFSRAHASSSVSAQRTARRYCSERSARGTPLSAFGAGVSRVPTGAAPCSSPHPACSGGVLEGFLCSCREEGAAPCTVSSVLPPAPGWPLLLPWAPAPGPGTGGAGPRMAPLPLERVGGLSHRPGS